MLQHGWMKRCKDTLQYFFAICFANTLYLCIYLWIPVVECMRHIPVLFSYHAGFYFVLIGAVFELES